MIVQLQKIIRDLWIYRLRTGLSIFAISVGLVVFGGVATALNILTATYESVFRLSNPAQVKMQISDFEVSLLRRIPAIDGVFNTDARFIISNARINISGNEWIPLELNVSDDYSAISMHKIYAEPGINSYTPPQGSIWLDRSILKHVNVAIGDWMVIETANGKQYDMQLAGFVNDVIAYPSDLSDQAIAYSSYDTVRDMNLTVHMRPHEPIFNTLYLRFSNPTDDVISIRAHVADVQKKIQSYGYRVLSTDFLNDAPPLETQTKALDFLLVISTILSFSVTTVMIANFVSAIMARQINEIGIMKSLGAVPTQILSLFFLMMIIMGLIAFILSLPLTDLMAQTLNAYLANMIDIDVKQVTVPFNIRIVQFVAALLIPIVASLFPIMRGAMLTVKETLRADGTTTVGFVKWLAIIPRLIMPSIILRMSFLNIFLRPGRFLLTTLSLTLPGALFIASFGIETGLRNLDTRFVDSLYDYDIEFSFDGYLSRQQVERIAEKEAGVSYVEAWRQATIHRIYRAQPNVPPNPTTGNNLPPPSVGNSRPMVPPPNGANRPPPPNGAGQLPPPPSGAGQVLPPSNGAGTVPSRGGMIAPELPAAIASTANVRDSISGDILLQGVPIQSKIMRFSDAVLLSGSWLQDSNDLLLTYEGYEALSINVDRSPTITVGFSTDTEDDWDIVGVTGKILTEEGFVDVRTFEKLIPSAASSIRLAIVTDSKDINDIAQVIESLRTAYNKEGIDVNSSLSIRTFRQRRSARLSLVTQTLIILSIVVGAVSVIGLISTISINIRERTKSIGILRSLGGDYRHMGLMVFIESLTIVLSSYVLAFALSFTVGEQMTSLLGQSIYSLNASYALEPYGAVVWFIIIGLVGFLGAIGPALYAINITISDTLRYEG